MANTQTTVPTFIPGQVLEASQLVNSAATGVPVFATTVTRDAGFGGAGEKALAEGQLCYLESTNVVQYYDGAAWATLAPAPAASSGLTFISSGSFGTSTTFSLPNNSFTATYLNYLLVINNVTMTLPANLMMRYRASGTDATSADYDFNVGTIAFAGSYAAVGSGASNTQMRIGSLDSTAISCTTGQIYIFNPQTAAPTSHTFQVQADSLATLGAGRFNLTTSFDAVTFRAQSGAGTFGSGTYTLYGLAVS